MTLRTDPWGDEPDFEWDEFNEEEIWSHRVTADEVMQCFENEHMTAPHRKAKTEPEKYGDRYLVRGTTDAGRKLLIVVQHPYSGWNLIRPVTARDDQP